MIKIYLMSYFLLALAATVGIVAVDEDPTDVSLEEWVLYAVLIYAAASFLRLYLEAKTKGPRR
jgi:hypothetical protein